MIERIPYPNPLPTEQNDYVKQNDLIETNFLDMYKAIEVISGNITRGSTFNCGGTIYLATSNTAIADAPSDYVKLTPSADGSVLTPSYVANLVGVSWNQVYNGYYDGSSPANLYIFDEAKAVIDGEIAAVKTKYVVKDENGNVNVSGQLNFLLNEGFVLKVPDNLITTNSTNLISSDAINKTVFTEGSEAMAIGAIWIPPEGIYNFAFDVFYGNVVRLEYFILAAWHVAGGYGGITGTVFCDGSNMRLNNISGAPRTVYYQKFN